MPATRAGVRGPLGRGTPPRPARYPPTASRWVACQRRITLRLRGRGGRSGLGSMSVPRHFRVSQRHT
ncbi:MAG: hypothetical protein HEQ38_03415 [Gemmatimonas sp.]|uniref:hypothetical protein n=1 Tax=Gemmatimonas sp. TaxID=1962908 RepID=UPI0031C7F3E3|nr:hypothetical protein [Gemmatimonas sp.]